MTEIRYIFRKGNFFLNTVIALAAMLIAVVGGQSAAQTNLPPNAVQIIQQIGTLHGGPNAVDYALRELRFPPPVGLDGLIAGLTYQQLPDPAKLKVAYSAANAAEDGSGNAMLREIMVLVAKRNIAITADPAFTEFVVNDPTIDDIWGDAAQVQEKVVEHQARQFAFAQPSRDAFDTPLPTTARSIIKSVSRLSPRVPGGLATLVNACCGIPTKQAFDMMVDARGVEELIGTAILTGGRPRKLPERVAALVEHAVDNNFAFTADDVMRKMMDTDCLQWASRVVCEDAIRKMIDTPNPSAPAQDILKNIIVQKIEAETGAAEATDHVARVVARAGGDNLPHIVELLSSVGDSNPSVRKYVPGRSAFVTFLAREYGVLHGRMSFSDVRARHGGFGVILGNEVTSQDIEPSPTVFDWVENNVQAGPGGDPFGMLFIRFSDGSIGFTPPVRRSFARAALDIVFIGLPGTVDALDVTSGDAVGLVGYIGKEDIYELDGNRIVKGGRGKSFVVHPLLAGLEIGEDVVMVDAVPFNLRKKLETSFDEILTTTDQVPPGGSAKRARAMFEDWLNDEERSTYKFIDVPMVITRPDGVRLSLHRGHSRNDDPSWTDQLRSESYLTFQKFDEQKRATDEEDPPFYALTPFMFKAWPSFHRLNEFAEILAYARWLKKQGAVPLALPTKFKRGPIFTTLAVGSEEHFRLDQPVYDMKVALAEDVDRAGRILLTRADALAKLLDAIHDNRLERLALDEAMVLYSFDLLVKKYADANTLLALRYYIDKYSPLDPVCKFNPFGRSHFDKCFVDEVAIREILRDLKIGRDNHMSRKSPQRRSFRRVDIENAVRELERDRDHQMSKYDITAERQFLAKLKRAANKEGQFVTAREILRELERDRDHLMPKIYNTPLSRWEWDKLKRAANAVDKEGQFVPIREILDDLKIDRNHHMSKFYNTKEGQFLAKLKRAANDANQDNLLARSSDVMILEFASAFGGETLLNLIAERKELSAKQEDIEVELRNKLESDEPDVDYLRSHWRPEDAQLVADAEAMIRDLTDTLSSHESWFWQRWLAFWQIQEVKENLDLSIQKANSNAKLSRIAFLKVEADRLSAHGAELEAGIKEQSRLDVTAHEPNFALWWSLQTSFEQWP